MLLEVRVASLRWYCAEHHLTSLTDWCKAFTGSRYLYVIDAFGASRRVLQLAWNGHVRIGHAAWLNCAIYSPWCDPEVDLEDARVSGPVFQHQDLEEARHHLADRLHGSSDDGDEAPWLQATETNTVWDLCDLNAFTSQLRLVDQGAIIAGPPCSLFVSACASVHKRSFQNLPGNLEVYKVRLANRIWLNFASGCIDWQCVWIPGSSFGMSHKDAISRKRAQFQQAYFLAVPLPFSMDDSDHFLSNRHGFHESGRIYSRAEKKRAVGRSTS